MATAEPAMPRPRLTTATPAAVMPASPMPASPGPAPGMAVAAPSLSAPPSRSAAAVGRQVSSDAGRGDTATGEEPKGTVAAAISRVFHAGKAALDKIVQSGKSAVAQDPDH